MTELGKNGTGNEWLPLWCNVTFVGAHPFWHSKIHSHPSLELVSILGVFFQNVITSNFLFIYLKELHVQLCTDYITFSQNMAKEKIILNT